LFENVFIKYKQYILIFERIYCIKNGVSKSFLAVIYNTFFPEKIP